MEDNEKSYLISIIICHWQGNLIYHCLNSLENVKAQKIVVTTDMDYHKIFSDVSTLYLIKELNNPTLKRNQGAILAKGEYLVFMDDDVEVKSDCIDNMADYLDNHSEVGMLYAMLYKMDNHAIIDTSGSFLTWCGFLYETYLNRISPLPILSGKSALCMIRKDLFDKIGKFDEDFVIYGEETDLSWRVWLAGYKIMVLPSAIGYHAFETSLKPGSYYNQKFIHYHGCKNYLTMLIKNLPARKLYIVGINALIWLLVSFALWFRNRKGAIWIWQGIGYNIVNFKYIWNKRKKIERVDENFYKYIYRNPPISYYINRFTDYIQHQLHGGISEKNKP